MKDLVFVLNIKDWQEFMSIHDDYTECATYEDTNFAIERDIDKIMTTSIIHCNEDVKNKNYQFYLYYNSNLKKINQLDLFKLIHCHKKITIGT